MKAYKLVTIINGKFYSYITTDLKPDLETGIVVQYKLNKKTTYKRNTKFYKFLFCFKSLSDITPGMLSIYDKAFECNITKSRSKDTKVLNTKRFSIYNTVPASSVTLTKDVTDQIIKRTII